MKNNSYCTSEQKSFTFVVSFFGFFLQTFVKKMVSASKNLSNDRSLKNEYCAAIVKYENYFIPWVETPSKISP